MKTMAYKTFTNGSQVYGEIEDRQEKASEIGARERADFGE
jgi:hypothetical protein